MCSLIDDRDLLPGVLADEDEGTFLLIFVLVDLDRREKADFVDLTLLIVGAGLEDLTSELLLLFAVPDDILVEPLDFLVGATLRSITLEGDAAVFFDGIDDDGLRFEEAFACSFSELSVDSISSLASDEIGRDGLRDEAFVDAFSMI